MGSMDGPLLISIALRIVHATGYLAVGGLYGWWIGRRAVRKQIIQQTPSAEVATPAPVDTERAEALLAHLYGLTTDVAHGVGEHSSYVAAVGRELNALADAGESRMITPVVQAIASLLHANSRLEEQLAHASQKMHEQAQELELQLADALTDPLTRIANRRSFDRELARRIPEFKRLGTPLSLVMVDVDFFKKFNDQHGHQAGDEVLRGVAKALKETVREMDLPARFGGEEFAVVLPTSDLAQARRAAERIRLAIDRSRFRFEGADLRVTASIGVSGMVGDDDAAALIKRADIALYTSKKAGRNCSHLHDGVNVARIEGEMEAAPLASEPIPAPAIEPAPVAAPVEEPATRPISMLEQQVDARLAQAARSKQPATLLLLEIDASRVRDPELQQLFPELLSQAVHAVVSERDFAVRASANTLAATLKGKDAAATVDVADIVYARMVEACRAKRLPLQSCRVNLGIAETAPGDTAQRVLERAQEALTAARRHGGNCVFFHTAQTRQPMLAELQAAANA